MRPITGFPKNDFLSCWAGFSVLGGWGLFGFSLALWGVLHLGLLGLFSMFLGVVISAALVAYIYTVE